jgi:hypothetical protein
VSAVVVLADYNGLQISFTDDGWFDATAVALHHGRVVGDFLDLDSTKEYLAALDDDHKANTGKTGIWKRARRGHRGGTWLHPRLGVLFARWLDARFAVWCDGQLDTLLRGKADWRKLRHEASASYKVMQQILQMQRADEGKTCAPHHYSNEARLVNFALTGKFEGIDRDALPADQLDLLAKLEERNAVLIGRGLPYEKRKTLLEQFAIDWRLARMPRVANG